MPVPLPLRWSRWISVHFAVRPLVHIDLEIVQLLLLILGEKLADLFVGLDKQRVHSGLALLGREALVIDKLL